MTTSKILFYTGEEKERLYKAIEKDNTRYMIRNRAMIKIALYCALRVNEVSLIDLDDINIEKREIFCKRTQESINNTLKIVDDDVFDSLLQYYNERTSQSYNQFNTTAFFVSQIGKPISRKTLHTIINKYCSAAYIEKEKRHFHVLKHTRVLDLYEANLEIQEVQWWVGHKSIENTALYLPYTNRKVTDDVYKKIIKNIKEKKDKKE